MTDKANAVANELASAIGIRQAAKMLRYSTNGLYVAASKGRIRILRIGSKLYIPASEVERILLTAESC